MKNLSKIFYLFFILSFLLSCNDDTDNIGEPDFPSMGYIKTTLRDFYTDHKHPMSVEIYNDKIYIGDTKTVITIFDRDFNQLGELKDADGETIEADVVRFNNDGSFFTHNLSDHTVSYYDASGTLKNRIEINALGNNNVNPIAVDHNGHLFVNCDHHVIRKYDAGLNNVIAISEEVSTLFDTGGGKCDIRGVCTDINNNVFITVDVNISGRDAILKFDNDLNFLTSVGGSGHFNNPHGIGADNDGNIYVASRYQHAVKAYSNDLKFLKATSEGDEPGDSSGLMDSPIGVGIDGNLIYVAESGNHCITVFRTYY